MTLALSIDVSLFVVSSTLVSRGDLLIALAESWMNLPTGRGIRTGKGVRKGRGRSIGAGKGCIGTGGVRGGLEPGGGITE